MNNDDVHNSFKKEDKVENGLDYYPETLLSLVALSLALWLWPKQMTEKQLRSLLKTTLKATSPHLFSGLKGRVTGTPKNKTERSF